ncbi:hypothetical protein GCM10027168_31970 [Streptomyces capparidis]
MGPLVPSRGEISPGALLTGTHRYTRRDVAAFDDLTGRAPDPRGADVLPGLLVLAPLTRLGGELDYIARAMTWRQERPVAVGEPLEAELELVRSAEEEAFHRLTFDARVRASGSTVLTGSSEGVVLKPGAPSPAASTAAPAAGPAPDRAPARPALPEGLAPGTVLRGAHRATHADISRCAELTGDHGAHHAPGLGARRIAHGLLTAAAVPLLRGDRGFHAASVSLALLRPVFAEETVECETRITAAGQDGPRSVALAAAVTNARGAQVLAVECAGAFPG